MSRPFGKEIIATQDVFIEALINPIPNLSIVDIFATNPAVSDTVWEDIWEFGGVFTWPTTADTIDIVSSVATDNITGTGARTAKVTGLDVDYNEISETITFTGVTTVVTTNSYLRLFKIQVLTSGSSGFNDGNISITHTTSGDDLGLISIGLNSTRLSHFTAPATGDCVFFRAIMNHVDNVKVSFRFQVKRNSDPDNVWVTIRELELLSGFENIEIRSLLPNKADFRIQAQSANASNPKVSAGVSILNYK